MSKYDCELNLEDRNSLSILLTRIKPNSTVLEFGPANGRMTKYMKEQLNCKVYAVEIDSKAAKDAEKYVEKMIVDSIENYNWQKEFKNIKFDYIIFADVLEHLYYPEKVLKSVKEFLSNNGSVLLSIPNISHNAIVLGLLKNEFNYSSTGLLDDTHIRFFTKKTFDKIIENCQYFKSFETAVYLHPLNTEFRYSYEGLPKEFSDYISKLDWGEIYQLIYEIKLNKIELISDFNYRYKNNKNFVQLFINTGNGFIEENSIKESFDNQSKIKFDISGIDNIKGLRFDPLNDKCILKINNILINDEKVEVSYSNSYYVQDNIYYFHTDDSQIYLDISKFKKMDIISFELEYINISEDASNEIRNHLFKVFDMREKEIKNLNEDLVKKEENIKNLNEDLFNIYTSKSWKLTSFLRSLAKKLKFFDKR